MEQYNVHEAKTHLSRLLARVEAGEEFIISRDGRPVARLSACSGITTARRSGGWRGRVWIADDFDELDEETAAAFRGERP